MALKKSQKSLKKWTAQKWDYVSKGDKIMVYGSGSEADGPASEGWKIKLKYTWTGDQIVSDFLLPP